MRPEDISVLTIAGGRAAHLANVVRGLARQSAPPREFVVAVMQDAPYDLPDAPFPVRQVRVPRAGAELPLAAARNAAAAAAGGAGLVFVDVDCIPAPTLVADYARHLAPGAGCLMGEVMYLPAGAAARIDYDAFDAVAEKHSDRRGPPEGEAPERCEDYRCFWSLNFALARADFDAAGGFDEAYRGYGGEDTDFGKTLSMRGGRLWWVRGARVYHQHHAHAMPPLHHMQSVIRNAEIFRAKWGYRTMEHWLYAFELMGLIRKTGVFPHEEVEVLRAPTEADHALCRQTDEMPYANTARVIRRLQERAAGRKLPREEAAAAMRAAQARLLGGARHAAE